MHKVKKIDKQPGREWRIRAIVMSIFGQVLMKYSWLGSGNPFVWLRDNMSNFCCWGIGKAFLSTTIFALLPASFYYLVQSFHLGCLWIHTIIWNAHFWTDKLLFILLFTVKLICKCGPGPSKVFSSSSRSLFRSPLPHFYNSVCPGRHDDA